MRASKRTVPGWVSALSALFLLVPSMTRAQTTFRTPVPSATSFCGGATGSVSVRLNGPNLPVACFFVVELSNASGSFASGTQIIGTTAPQTFTTTTDADDDNEPVPISIAIPFSAATASGYRVRVHAQNPSTLAYVLTSGSNSNNITLTNPTVAAPGDRTFCPGSASVNFTSGGGATSITWSNSNTAIGLASSGTGNLSFTASNSSQSQRQATITIRARTSSCTGPASTFLIRVNPRPAMSGLANQQVCHNTGVTLPVFSSTIAGSTFAWSNNQGGIGLPASGSGNLPFFTPVNPTGSASVATVSVTPSLSLNGTTCAGTAGSFTITVNPARSASVSFPSNPYCASGSVTPAFSGTPGGTWSSATPQLVVNNTSGVVNLSNAPAGTHTISYALSAAGGCPALVASAQLTVRTESVWTGAVSSSWHDNRNWCGALPNASVDALVPQTSIQPVVSSQGAVRNLTIAQGASVQVSTGDLNVLGNISGDGVLTGTAAGKLTLSGIADQELPGITVGQLVVGGSGLLRLRGPVVIAGQVTLAGNGRSIELGEYNLEAGSILGGGANGFIVLNGNGKLSVRNVGAEQRFPVGIRAGSYSPLTIRNGGNRSWSVGLKGMIVPAAVNPERAIQRVWNITPSSVSPEGVTLVFQYNEADSQILGSAFDTQGRVVVNHHNGTVWEQIGGPLQPEGQPGGSRTVTIDGVNDFSPFAISNAGSPLPVRLLSFSGRRQGRGYQLEWTTGSEWNNLGFHVERSSDGRAFQQVGFVRTLAPGGNSSTLLSYQFSDPQAAGNEAFYRLAQKDVDGSIRYSRILRFSDATGVSMTLSPNPVDAATWMRISVNVSESAELVIVDGIGRILRRNRQLLRSGLNSFSLDTEALQPGHYLVRLIGADGSIRATAAFVKR